MTDFDFPEFPETSGQDPASRDAHDKLGQISDAAHELREVQREVEELEQHLKGKKERLRILEETKIPALLDEYGVSSITLNDGTVVSVGEEIVGSFPKGDRAEEAAAWLMENGHSGLIKETMEARFNYGESYKAAQLIEKLNKHGIPTEVKKTVPHQTLKAWAREREKEGEELPFKTLGLYRKRKTKTNK